MAQQTVSEWPELVNASWECAKAAKICAVRSKEQNLDCWKCCDICATISEATAKVLITGGTEEQPMMRGH
jgi:hypothetical protein